MTAIKTVVTLVSALLLSPLLMAEETAERTATERWLELQRSGLQASAKTQAATPAERELALQRWLDNQHPIPEYFQQDVEGELER